MSALIAEVVHWSGGGQMRFKVLWLRTDLNALQVQVLRHGTRRLRNGHGKPVPVKVRGIDLGH